MMTPTYYVYAGDKGFWGNGGTYVSQFRDAKEFTREAAIDFCRRRVNKAVGDMPCVPVPADDMREVLG